MADEPWFRTEKTGLAAQPASWKGWTAIGVYTAALVVLAVICFGLLPMDGINVIIFIVLSLTCTVALIVVAMRKTEGDWAWNRRPPPADPNG